MNISFFAEKTNMVGPKFLNRKTKLTASLVHYNVSIINKKTESLIESRATKLPRK
jgi:hypothetical protein